jgi:radical SAM protein with 4Fe4S-binding SPASM domain
MMKQNKVENSTQFCDSKYDRRKIFYHPQAIASLLTSGDCWPITVSTGFTTYCNHSCSWCASAYTTRKSPSLKTRDELLIQPEIWIKNIQILAKNGTKGLNIAGQGEPLLHPLANQMLDAVAECGLKYMLFTNGECLSEKFYDSLFTGAVAVRFSVDAATAEMHARWHAASNSNGRGKANFKRVVDNIRNLVAEKRRRGTYFPTIVCQMICSKLTEDDFESFANLFQEVGVDYIVYKSLQYRASTENMAISSLDLHETQAEREVQAQVMLDRLLKIKQQYENDCFEVQVKVDQIQNAYVKQFNGAERYNCCRAYPLTPMMEPDGNVYLCIDHGGKPEFVIGNIYQNTIDEIWRSQQRQEAIKRIDLKQKCPAGCFLDETNVILHQLANPDPSFHSMLI